MNLHKIPLDRAKGGLSCGFGGGRGEERVRAYVCRFLSRKRESQLLASGAGCNRMVEKRDERKADRRRGTKYEMNSWNDGEERARERVRRKQLDPDASTAARRRMLRRGGSRGRRRKRQMVIEGDGRIEASAKQREGQERERDRPAWCEGDDRRRPR